MQGGFGILSPRATIAIVTLNEEARIARCLAALQESGAGEIWIIDNGSTDRTCAIVEEIRRDLSIPLRLERMPSNHLGMARQKALCLASFPWVAFIDADCVAPRGWLQGLLDFFERKTEERLLGVGSGNYAPLSPLRFHRALRIVLSSFFGHLGSTQAHCPRKEKWVPHLSTCNVLYHRERLLGVGGFSKEFGEVCEDLELSIRARGLGMKLLYVPGFEVLHDHRPSYLAWATKMIRYGRGQIRVMRKHFSFLIGVKLLPLLFLLSIILAFYLKLKVGLGVLFAYGVFVLTLSIYLAIRNKALGLIPQIFGIFSVTHFCYAFGEFVGLVRIFFR